MMKKIQELICKDFGWKLLSIAIATILWFMVINIDQPVDTRTYSRPLSIENMETLTDRGLTIGNLEELNVTGYFDSGVGMYTKLGIYAEADGSYHYEACFADGFLPYYVKTADGHHYLYLFCEQNEGAFPMYSLKAFDVRGGKAADIGERNVGPGYLPDGIYRVPTDPEKFYLDDFDSMAQDMMAFAVGPNGLPEQNEGGLT